jgi:hypothetical protein
VNAVTAVAVEIQPRPQVEGDEIEVVDDLDEISSTEAMMGCGEDNPY